MMESPALSAILDRAGRRFLGRFGRPPELAYRAPGRVNLVGEHTDYSGGLVLPVAVERAVLVVAAPARQQRIRLYSATFDEDAEVALGAAESRSPSGHWVARIGGLVTVLAQAGYQLAGCDVVIDGNLPIGAGLASSAALMVAVARALLAVAGRAVPPVELARLCQQAEEQASGVQCGIMDQLVATLGRRGHALLLDCRDATFQHVPLDEGHVRVVLADSGLRRSLASGQYNARRGELAAALSWLARAGRPASPRQVSAEEVSQIVNGMPPTPARRFRHVVEENARVVASADALHRGDVAALGQLMLASHASLRDLYQVSTPELDALVALAAASPGCLGAKLTGAGFGGATVNLVQAAHVERFCQAVGEGYRLRTGREAQLAVCSTADGAAPLQLRR